MALNETELEILSALVKDVGYIRGKVEDLSGPQGRVTAVEESLKEANRRQWWHSAIVLGTSQIGHTILRHLGL